MKEVPHLVELVDEGALFVQIGAIFSHRVHVLLLWGSTDSQDLIGCMQCKPWLVCRHWYYLVLDLVQHLGYGLFVILQHFGRVLQYRIVLLS